MADEVLIISDLSGGRNGVDAPTSDDFPADQCVLVENMDYRNGGLGRRRGGSVDVVSLISASGLGANPIRSLFRHDPGEALTTWEMWMFDNNNVIARLPVGAACSNPTHIADFNFAAGSGAYNINAVSFNGKLFLFYVDGAAQDRNKVYGGSGVSELRYVGGIPGAVAPTAADGGGAGAYAAVQRYYRVRWLVLNGTSIVSRSEPTPAVAFTPSGANANATVTRPVVPAFSNPTHWELEFSPDGSYFYGAYALGSIFGSPVAIATTTATDVVTVVQEPGGPLSHPIGTYTNLPRAKYGVTDGNRLVIANLGFQGFGSRVAWSPVLGSLDVGDDERMFQTATIKPYIDLNTKNGGDITGLSQVNGVIYPFKMKEVWRMTPTTSLESPYISKRLSRVVGAVSHKSIAEGENAVGDPVIYFMSHKGPYRVGGSDGLEYLGRDLEDVTRTLAGLPNINTNATVVSHSVYHADLGQWWVWLATGANATPNRLFIFDVKRGVRRDRYGVRGGWTEFTGDIASATCSAMGPYTLAGTVNYRPWIGLTGNGKVSICDRDDTSLDVATTFFARFKTRSVYKFGKYIRIGEMMGICRHGDASGISLRVTIDPDYGQGLAVNDDASSAVNQDVYLPLRWESATMADAMSVQIQIAETAANEGYWEIVQLKVPVFVGGDV